MPGARAATSTWNSAGTDTNFGTAGDWTPTGAPASGSSLSFGAASGTKTNLNNDLIGYTFAGLTFTGASAFNDIWSVF